MDESLLWRVRLSDSHPGYQQVSLRRRPGYPDYQVVMVDAKKLIDYSDQDIRGFVIPPVEQWDVEKRRGMFAFLAPPTPRERHVEMPIVSFNRVSIVRREPFLWIFRRTKAYQAKYVSYTNGRHRARYLYYAGATGIPVMCHKNNVDALLAHCGAAVDQNAVAPG